MIAVILTLIRNSNCLFLGCDNPGDNLRFFIPNLATTRCSTYIGLLIEVATVMIGKSEISGDEVEFLSLMDA